MFNRALVVIVVGLDPVAYGIMSLATCKLLAGDTIGLRFIVLAYIRCLDNRFATISECIVVNVTTESMFHASRELRYCSFQQHLYVFGHPTAKKHVPFGPSDSLSQS
jgi:hypothetical protein